MTARIVITGAGVISATGCSCDEFARSLKEPPPEPKIHAPVAPFMDQAISVRTVEHLRAEELLGKKGLQYLSRGTQMLLCATIEAMQQAQLAADQGGRVGVVIGTNFGALRSVVSYDHTVITQGSRFVSPMEAPNTLANAPASYLSVRLGAQDINMTLSTGCCASLDAVGVAATHLEREPSAFVLAGGVEELNPPVLWQYQALGFTGSVIPGEAAAVLALESEATAAARGATPRATIAGWANRLAPSESTSDRVAAVCAELASTSAAPLVSLVIAGLNGSARDAALRDGVARVLNATTPIFSIKDWSGETYGAAGALGVAAACTFLAADASILVVDDDPAGFTSAVLVTRP